MRSVLAVIAAFLVFLSRYVSDVRATRLGLMRELGTRELGVGMVDSS